METEKLECDVNNAVFAKGINIAGIDVGIYSDTIQLSDKTYGIPCLEQYDKPKTENYNLVVHKDSEIVDLSYDFQRNSFLFQCPYELIQSGKSLLFLALALTERSRQLKSQLLSHGAGLVSPDGNAVLLLGNAGAGKTTLALNLCKRGFLLAGNDQIIIGKRHEDSDIMLLGGTEYITIRETALRNNSLDKYNLNLSSNGGFGWNNKQVFSCEELGIKTSREPALIKKTYLIYLDAAGNENTGINRIDANNVGTNLFLGEKFSRHISGVATHLLSDAGYLLTHTPSLDDHITRKNRLNIINELYKIGIYELYGNNVDEMLDLID